MIRWTPWGRRDWIVNPMSAKIISPRVMSYYIHESLHLKKEGMLFPSDFKQKLCWAETWVFLMVLLLVLLKHASITFSSLFHEIQLSQSNHLHSFHTFFLQVSGKFVSPFSSWRKPTINCYTMLNTAFFELFSGITDFISDGLVYQTIRGVITPAYDIICKRRFK